jgi:hypothetical protein
MRAPLVIIVALLGLTLPGVALQPDLALTATTDGGAWLACARVAPGDELTLAFTHSMYGGDVRETYRVADDGRLVRERMVTDNAAAAEYYAWDGRVARTDGGYEVIGPAFATDDLVVRVDARGDHRLTAGDWTWRLADAVARPTRVRIAVTAGGCA